MKCYYEVLNIPRDSEASEIKAAYRKLALKWHPDKNLDNSDEAKEQFQAVQNAYEVLSCVQERAWYDSHREQLLRGAGSTFNDESIDLIPFFTASCYKGFGDDEKGFYGIYKEVFHKLASEEVDYLDDPEDVSSIPMFGKSDTDYDSVHEFYSYWQSFSTAKSYVWLDKYDLREADNRKILKLLEKENNKIRQKARKERNDEVRQLVIFIRRRDKRVLAHTKLLEEEAVQNKKKREQVRKEKLVQRQRDLEEAKQRQSGISVYSMDDFHEKLDQIEKHLTEEFGHSDAETLSGSTDEEDSENPQPQAEKMETEINNIEDQDSNYNRSQSMYCTACNKLFKNIKSFQNHENSKKHKENVLDMKLDTHLDFSDSEDTSTKNDNSNNKNKVKIVDDINEDMDDLLSEEEEIVAETKKKKKKNKNHLRNNLVNHFDVNIEENLDDLNDVTRSRRARKAKSIVQVISKIKESKEVGKKLLVDIQDTNDVDKIDLLVKINTPEIESNNLQLNMAASETVAEISDDIKSSEKKTKATMKQAAINKKKEKKSSHKTQTVVVSELDITDVDTSHCCAICKSEYTSKNKLFDHLKKSGHSILLPGSRADISNKGSKKKSSKK